MNYTTSSGKRTRWFPESRPEGNELYHVIWQANEMVSRCWLLIVIGLAFNVQWALGQPDSSLMVEYESVLYIL